MIVVLQESITKISWRDTLCRQESVMAAGGLRPRQQQRGVKLQRKNAGGRKSEQHPYHPQPKPSCVQSAVGFTHQESVSTAPNKHARIDHQPSPKSSSARNEPSCWHQGFDFDLWQRSPWLKVVLMWDSEHDRLYCIPEVIGLTVTTPGAWMLYASQQVASVRTATWGVSLLYWSLIVHGDLHCF